MNEIVQVPFRSHTIEAFGDGDGGYLVALKPICENMGVDYSGQLARLKEQPWATVGVTPTVAKDGKVRSMTVIDRQTLVMWLATIDSSRLKSERARLTVVEYQKECAGVLDSYFSRGIAVAPQRLEEMIADPDFAIGLLQGLKRERERAEAERERRVELEQANAEMAPKALFADAVSASKTSILVGELAKILKQNGVEGMGQNRLFAWLRDKGYLMRFGSSYNMPTQRSMELGLFEIKETSITHSDGHVTVSRTPKVTGKGQQYFIGKFLATA